METTRTDPRKLAVARAARAYGVLTRRDLGACGYRRAMLRTDLRNGWLEELAPGVYRIGGSPDTWEQRVMAATRLGNDVAAAARATAIALHGFSRRHRTGTPHIVLPRGREVEVGDLDVVVHHSRTLGPEDLTAVGGIRSVTVARALIDQGIDDASLRWCDDAAAAIRDHLTDTEALLAQLSRAGNIANGGRLRRHLLGIDPDTGRLRAHSEGRFIAVLVAYGVPRPIANYEILDLTGALVREVDAAWPHLELAWDVDSREWHTLPSQVLRDEVRDLVLAELGWDVRRVPYQLIESNPRYVVRRVVRSLEQAAARHGVSIDLPAV